MRAAGHQFAGNPFQIATQLFELDAWSVVIGLGACLHYPSQQGFEPRRWRGAVRRGGAYKVYNQLQFSLHSDWPGSRCPP